MAVAAIRPTSGAQAVPASVVAAVTLIEGMFKNLEALRARGWGALTLSISDINRKVTQPTLAEESGYIDWPTGDFKALELAWAQALTYLGLSGLEWKFPLRRKVSDAYAITQALLTKARQLQITNVQVGVPWSLIAIAGLTWFFVFRKATKSKARKRR